VHHFTNPSVPARIADCRRGCPVIRAFALASVLLLTAVLFAAESPRAGAEELVINGGFEAGSAGWSFDSESTQLEIVSQSHSGSSAARITSTNFDGEIYQIVPIAPNSVYQLSAWVINDDPEIDRVFARIRWLDSLEPGPGPYHDSAWVQLSAESYQYTYTTLLVSPPDAVAARVSIQGVSNAKPFSFTVDDVSLQGSPPPSLTPTTQPTPTQSPTPTQPPTSAPTATPTLTSSPTPTPTPTPTPKPTPTPIAPPTPTEPLVFSVLTNGGFEQPGTNGAPFGWRKIGGDIYQSSSHVRTGVHSLQLRSATSSTKWAFQTVTITGGAYYAATAYARNADLDIDAVFLRVSWYETSDGSGEAISSVDSAQLLDTPQSIFRTLSTGPVPAPEDAHSARIRLMLRPKGAGEAIAYFDDVSFGQTSSPTTAPTPTTTVPPDPGSTPPPVTAPPTASASPTPVPTFAPPEDKEEEPKSFPVLTNWGFEIVREDGTPYGWHKVGGEFSADDTSPAEGSLALMMRSDTTSTKWVHQAVSVTGSRWYEFTGFGSAPGSGTETFLRVSWYASKDGSGSALSSVDSSTSITGPASGYHFLTTGPVQAPPDALSVRLRLMLRPSGPTPIVAYFDSLTFGITSAPPGDANIGGSGTTPRSGTSPSSTTGDSETEEPTQRSTRAPVLGVAATPFDVVNPNAGEGKPPAQPAADSGGGPGLIWILIAIGVPVIGIALIGGVEARRWALRRRNDN
jgi:hypothetical protein